MSIGSVKAAEIPVVETARLRLRGHGAADLARCTALWTNPEVVRYTVGTPQTEEAVWSRMLRYLGLWSMLGFGYWVIEEKATGAFVGEVGLCNYHRAIEPALGQEPEIGWILHPDHHGKGYATEAARAVMEWLNGVYRGQVSCIVHVDNAGSVRVAEKLGFVRSHRAVYREEMFEVLYAEA